MVYQRYLLGSEMLKKIPGYEGYLARDDGRIWSCKKKGQFLNPQKHNRGYKQVQLFNEGKYRAMLIHRLVALAFIPNPYNLETVDHINRDRTDNRVENLRWASRKDQIENVGMFKTNTSGHTNISFNKNSGRWRFTKQTVVDGKRTYLVQFQRKSKIDCLCFKFIYLLKVRAGLIL
jgi:hypothetical protein